MKNLIKITFLTILVLPTLFGGCKKEANIPAVIADPEVALEAVLHGRGVLLNWQTTTDLLNFEKYIVVRSKSPLPVNYEPSVVSNLLVFNTTNQNDHNYLDLNLPVVDKVYYTLFVDFGNRFVKSKETTVELGFQFFGYSTANFQSRYNAEIDLLYLFHQAETENQLIVFDVKTEAILSERSFPLSLNIDAMAFSKISELNEVYLGRPESGVGMTCETLDAYTLEMQNSLLLTENFGNLKFSTNQLGHLCYKGVGEWKVINASDGALFATHTNVKDSDYLFTIDNDDLQFIALGEDRMDYVKFDEVGNVENAYGENMVKTLADEMAVAPNGQTFLAYLDGSIFNKSLEKVGKLGENEEAFQRYAFSVDGTKIFAQEEQRTQIRQYNAITLELERTINFNEFDGLNNFFIDEKNMIIIGIVKEEIIVQTFDYTL